jgi:2-amino-4-hydroxy-6-hydroxymethyldihydropteridine diphosphokinase
MNILHILLGSNTDTEKHLAEAKLRLIQCFSPEIRFSDSIESLAVTGSGETNPEASTYLNAVCLAQTDLSLETVQNLLKSIETEMGRTKGSEVVLDLDLIEWNGEILRQKDADREYYKACLRNLR